MVPQVAVQVAAALAVNCCCAASFTVALVGEIENGPLEEVTVTVVEAV